jgi:hypothetical protein
LGSTGGNIAKKSSKASKKRSSKEKERPQEELLERASKILGREASSRNLHKRKASRRDPQKSGELQEESLEKANHEDRRLEFFARMVGELIVRSYVHC